MVESPTKAKALQSYLTKDWVVLATKGHIKDLPPKDYGIDFENNFSPTYVWLKGKKTLFSSIQKASKSANLVFIASDPDREGEMIAEHISSELGKISGKIYRIRLHEISKKALNDAIKTPGTIDTHLVESQICRRLIDRIFGFEISPVLWKDLKISGLSAGRVQSAVLKWICERELEIRNFISENYVSLESVIINDAHQITLSYVLPDEDKRLDQSSANTILKKYGMSVPGKTPKGLHFELKKVEEKKYKILPPRPFSTASLQETAAKALGFSSSYTMKIAQSLYEGINVKGEMIGLITYMRSDSTQVSEQKSLRAREYLKQTRPDLDLGKDRRSKSKMHAQEAHEAITPTDPFRTPASLLKSLTEDEAALYQLIWERTLVSFLDSETGLERSYTFEEKAEFWNCRQKEGISLGFKKFHPKVELPKDPLSNLKLGSSVICDQILAAEKQTLPKERYTEGQIIAKMERTGIGRPSTYSQTLETLQKRKYVMEVKKKLGATALGEKVNGHLVASFSELIGESFTKEMEISLDVLASGKGEKLTLLKIFFEKIRLLKLNRIVTSQSNLDKKDAKSKVKVPTTTKTEMLTTLCPVCKEGRIRSKFSKTGKTIYFCSRYPHCDFVSYEPVKKE
nr:type I DNA topoisomerase [Leptospira ognonensis]